MKQVAHITGLSINRKLKSPFDFMFKHPLLNKITPIFEIEFEEDFPIIRSLSEFFDSETGIFFNSFQQTYSDILIDINENGFIGFSHDIAGDSTTLNLGYQEFLIDCSYLPKGLRAGSETPFMFKIGDYEYVGYLNQRMRLIEQASLADESDISSLSKIISSPRYMMDISRRDGIVPLVTIVSTEHEQELRTHIHLIIDKKLNLRIYTSNIKTQARSLSDPFYLMESVTYPSSLYSLYHRYINTEVITLSDSFSNKIQNGTYLHFVEMNNAFNVKEPLPGTHERVVDNLKDYLISEGVTKIDTFIHEPSEYMLTLNGTTEAYLCKNDNDEVITYFYVDWFLHNSKDAFTFKSELSESLNVKINSHYYNDYIKFYRYYKGMNKVIDHRNDNYDFSFQLGLVAYDCGGGTRYLSPAEIDNRLVSAIYDARSEYNPAFDMFETLSRLRNDEDNGGNIDILMIPPIRIPVPDQGHVIADDIIKMLLEVISGFPNVKDLNNIFTRNALYRYLIKHLSQESSRYIIASPVIAYSKNENYVDFWAKMNKVIRDEETLEFIRKELKMSELNYIECKTEKGRIF